MFLVWDSYIDCVVKWYLLFHSTRFFIHDNPLNRYLDVNNSGCLGVHSDITSEVSADDPLFYARVYAYTWNVTPLSVHN